MRHPVNRGFSERQVRKDADREHEVRRGDKGGPRR